MKCTKFVAHIGFDRLDAQPRTRCAMRGWSGITGCTGRAGIEWSLGVWERTLKRRYRASTHGAFRWPVRMGEQADRPDRRPVIWARRLKHDELRVLHSIRLPEVDTDTEGSHRWDRRLRRAHIPGNLRYLATDSFRDSDGRTPLRYAALDDDVQGVEDGLQNGIDPDGADREGFTALHFAAQGYSVTAARHLLEGGATVDQVNRFGNSPLSTAVFNSKGRGEMILLLREWGADPFLANNYGKTPIELARMIANFDIAQFFGDLP